MWEWGLLYHASRLRRLYGCHKTLQVWEREREKKKTPREEEERTTRRNRERSEELMV